MHALPAITEAKDHINNITFDWVVDKSFSSVPKWHPNVKNTIETNHREWKLNLFSSKSRDEMKKVINTIDSTEYDLIIDMQSKKTGKLFSFCCVAPIIMSGKTKYLDRFNKIGNEIGLLFQIADDLIDLNGKTSSVGKKTRKDFKMGKATLISLLGTNNTIKYANKLKLNIFKNLNNFGKKNRDLKETINYILSRTK